ncbi:hypothetical protein CHS0354_010169 [Potamilus streckersoni]|uniref:Orn/DAP/Arg decarboxylase 2 N-terminal domain-containing protein n=1 Tax=Potamilus streckersoni TaxID=2493646 RepID=A0AAE0S3A4_9BIVA|nr:hypothetical protein CHS0354_010169 [Potamilus streckersoni]
MKTYMSCFLFEGGARKTAEIMSILELDIRPSRIAFSNTIKPTSSLRYAAQNGVELMAFDNEEELHKIHSVHPKAK